MREVDAAANALAATSPAFTRKNLFHAWRRLRRTDASNEDFVRGPLARRLARGPIAGLLPPSTPWRAADLPREWDSYFPKAIVLVDRLEILDLFVASHVLATAKLAVVCIDGSPAHVVRWLARGCRAGRRAPVGFLHDASTAFYPFAVEPLASMLEHAESEPLVYRDLGLPVRGLGAARFPFTSLPEDERVLELEALPPSAMIAYAAQRMLAMVPGDPMMAPLTRDRERGVTG